MMEHSEEQWTTFHGPDKGIFRITDIH